MEEDGNAKLLVPCFPGVRGRRDAATFCSKTPAVQAGAPEIPSVAVAQVRSTNLSKSLVLTAEFKPYQEVDVMAKVAGYIKQINVDIGDRVKKDQVLATLEIPEMGDDLTRANAAVSRANADVKRAQDELERAQSAHDIAELSYKRLNTVSEQRPGLVAQQEIDDARAKDLVAEAQVSAARSALSPPRNRYCEHGRSGEGEDHDGLHQGHGAVRRRDHEALRGYGIDDSGGHASQTQAVPVVRISQNQLLRLILPVPEKQTPTVHIGQAVDVIVPALHRTFPGKVIRFENKLSLETRTMDTEVDVENPSLTVLPGMYAEVDLGWRRTTMRWRCRSTQWTSIRTPPIKAASRW